MWKVISRLFALNLIFKEMRIYETCLDVREFTEKQFPLRDWLGQRPRPDLLLLHPQAALLLSGELRDIVSGELESRPSVE